MERKILKQLRDTARGKHQVVPVKRESASKSARRLYSGGSPQRNNNLRSAGGSRTQSRTARIQQKNNSQPGSVKNGSNAFAQSQQLTQQMQMMLNDSMGEQLE